MPLMPLAALSLHPSFAEALNFILLGFGLVMLVLILLTALTTLIGLTVKAFSRTPARVATPGSGYLPVEDPSSDIETGEPDQVSLPPETIAAAAAIAYATEHYGRAPAHHVAIIASAAEVLVGKPHRIVSIRSRSNDWAREGRAAIFAGRRVR